MRLLCLHVRNCHEIASFAFGGGDIVMRLLHLLAEVSP